MWNSRNWSVFSARFQHKGMHHFAAKITIEHMKHAPYGRKMEKEKKKWHYLAWRWCSGTFKAFTYKLGRTKHSKYDPVEKKRQVWNVLSSKRDIVVDWLWSFLFFKPYLWWSDITLMRFHWFGRETRFCIWQHLHCVCPILVFVSTREQKQLLTPISQLHDAHEPVSECNCVVAELALVRPRCHWKTKKKKT